MTTPREIQEIIDNCAQAAQQLRTEANAMFCPMERQTTTLGAAHLELAINSLVQAKILIE
jgi:hypothetical protein